MMISPDDGKAFVELSVLDFVKGNSIIPYFDMIDGRKPVWGSCFGLQAMMQFIGGFDRLERVNNHDQELSPT